MSKINQNKQISKKKLFFLITEEMEKLIKGEKNKWKEKKRLGGKR